MDNDDQFLDCVAFLLLPKLEKIYSIETM